MIGRSASFAAAFALAIVVGRQTVLPETGLALFWPAAGVAALWGILAVRRAEVALVGVLVALISGIGNALTGFDPAAATMLGLANAVIAVGSRGFLSWLRDVDGRRGQRNGLTRVSDFYRFLVAVTAATVLSAVAGMAGLAMSGASVGWAAALGWVIRNLAAVVVIAAPGLAARDSLHLVTRRAVGEAVPVVLGSLAVLWLVFGPGRTLPLAFVPFLAVVWAGLRLPLPLAAAQGLVVALGTLVLVGRLRGGPFGALTNGFELSLVLQGYMAIAVGLAVVLGAVQWERDHLVREIAQSARTARTQAEDLEVITGTIPDALLVVDRGGRILLSNEAAQQWLRVGEDGHVEAGLEAVTPRDLDGHLLPEDERPAARAFAGQRVRGAVLRVEDVELEEERTVAVDAVPLREEVPGPPQRVLLVIHDVSDEQARLEALTAERERTDRLISDAPHGVAVLDLDGRVLRVNDSLAGLAGRTAHSIVGKPFTDLSPEYRDKMETHLRRTLATPGSLLVGDWSIVGPHGTEAHVSLTSRALIAPDGAPDVVLVNVVDFSEQRKYEERLTFLADHDPLTGLLNRRRFDDVLDAQLRRHSLFGLPGALLLVDLDNFKEVNDTMGHGAGDELIVGIAQLLERSLRSSDHVARVGGDEFAVLVAGADQLAAETVAQTLIDGVREYAGSLEGVRRRVTASVGVATFADAAQQGVDPLALADMLLYDAKEAGRDQFAVLESSVTRPRTGARLEVQGRIEAALENDAFVLHLQPILELSTNRVVGAEALLRLDDGGPPLSPGRFVPVAERAGLAPALDRWVIRHAIELLARLLERDPTLVVEINLSGHSIGDPVVEKELVEALRTHDVPPQALVVEATETAAVADVPAARAFAERLAALGTRVAIDDFGAGFGSFYYLKHLPFDVVKIDGEFVVGCHESAVDRAILSSIVGIARNLGKETIAEFVAEAGVLAVVRELGVDYAQGYHIGEPVPVDEFLARHLPGGTSVWRTDGCHEADPHAQAVEPTTVSTAGGTS